MFLFTSVNDPVEKRWQNRAKECARRLSEQQIVPGNPGTILKDVETFLEFIGPGGIVTKSRNASLPAERLPELNAKMSHPIELVLKRPLLRDYPNLAGPFILLRVMDLVQMEGNRLVVCPAALKFWRSLNPTEQYFALLEALLFQAQSSVLGGERRREETEAFEMVTFFLCQLNEKWHHFDRYESLYTLGSKGELPPWNLFVQQQLGLLELEPMQFSEREQKRSGAGQGWHVGSARLTPWGTAMTWALQEFLRHEFEELEEEEADQPETGQQEFKMVEDDSSLGSDQAEAGRKDGSGQTELNEEDFEFDEEPEEWEPEPEFGILQAFFQPVFPEWRTVYARPEREAPRGNYIFKVSLTGWRAGRKSVWRQLALPPNASLDELAGAILGAFNFDDDHLYDFRYRDRRGKSRVYNRPEGQEGPFTTDITVAETELEPKDEMLFTFDYGDDWKFNVRLESIEAKASRLRRPKVVASAGKAPEQYPEAEDW